MICSLVEGQIEGRTDLQKQIRLQSSLIQIKKQKSKSIRESINLKQFKCVIYWVTH